MSAVTRFRTVKLPIQPGWRETLQHWAAEIRNIVADLFNASQGMCPTGSVILWTNETTMPDGWLKCDGARLSKEIYSNLYNVVGGRFGTETATTFQIPDMSGLVPASVSAGSSVVGTNVNITGTAGAANLQTMKLFVFLIKY